jgi:hypothetical protein
VDTNNTLLLLSGPPPAATSSSSSSNPSSLLPSYFAGLYAQYYNSAAIPDATGCHGWVLIGRAGLAGKGDGLFSVGPLLNMPVDLELSSDGNKLVISDYLNQRICVAHMMTKTLKTILGTGASCWNFGVASPDECAGTMQCGGKCGSISQPLGVGLSFDDSALYIVMNQQSTVGVLSNPLAVTPGTFSMFCMLDYTNAERYTEESCRISGSSRTCMLNHPFDVITGLDGSVFVGVSYGITIINSMTLACKQGAGEWWGFFNGSGFSNGGIAPNQQAPTSRLTRPFRLGVDRSRGILYVADYDNGAIRRVFVDGRCRCAEGSIYVSSALACYNPTPPWDTGLVMVSCPHGEFALEGDSECHPCSEAAVYGVSASVCLLYATSTKSQVLQQSGGFSFARVAMDPQPVGSIAADWYGSGAPETPWWDDIFRPDSPVTYRLGSVAGHAPWGGEFVSLTFDMESRLWQVETRSLLRPKRMLPGLWYPCTTAPIFAGPGASCRCTTVPAAFSDSNGTGGGSVRWSELREAARVRGGRIMGGSDTILLDFVGVRHTPSYETKILMWSHFMLLGTDAYTPEVCGQHGKGPCFPTFLHYQESEPSMLDTANRNDNPVYLEVPVSTAKSWTLGSRLICATGWPAHYSCPNGYTWVGPNTSVITDNGRQFMSDKLLTGQIACLSCLPGYASFVTESSRSKHGGPYSCSICDFGSYSTSVGSTACILCPSSTYANTTGATGCTMCPNNHFSVEGASDEGMCSPCVPGTGSCKDCVDGMYQVNNMNYDVLLCFLNWKNQKGIDFS